jgi:hypothetical protein
MKHHPEQLDGEIYMGNSLIDCVLKSSWKTIRRGNLALRRDGNPVCDPDPDFKPWFLKSSEVEAAIDLERRAGNSWSAERIKTLRSMVSAGTAP